MSILDVGGVHKRYLDRTALAGVSLTLDPGRVLGVLGPNGSGKTTLLKCIAGHLRPDAGTVAVAGEQGTAALRRRVAFLPDKEFLYGWLTVAGAGRTYRGLYPDFDQDAFAHLVDRLGLDPAARVRTLSKGTAEKLGLALTFARRAPVTVLDEPLSGVDPVAREEILRGIVVGMRSDAAVVVTSHLVGELEQILDAVVFLDAGTVVLAGEAEDLRLERGASLDGLYREVFAR